MHRIALWIRSRVRLDLLAVVGVLAGVSLWIDFSRIQSRQNGDSLVMSLVSLYHWTPLFWEQDRLGMLVPALATPFRSPLGNMLAQAGLTIFSGLASFFLLGYYLAGRRRGLAIGAVSAILFLLLNRESRRFGYLVYIHQFATSTTLALLALLAIEHAARGQRRPGWSGLWPWPTAFGLLGLALWVNPAAAFAIGPLVLARRALAGRRAREFDSDDGYLEACDPALDTASPAIAADSESWADRPRWLGLTDGDLFALAAIALGLGLSMAISRSAATEAAEYHLLGPRAWLACAWGVARDLPGQLDGRWFWTMLVVAALGFVPLCWPAGRRAARGSGAVALALLLAAAAQYAFVTSLEHVHRTDFGHYAFTAVFLWQGACVAFCVLQWAAVAPREHAWTFRAPWALLALFAVLAAARHGRPGLDVVRRSLAESIGRYSGEVLARGATHVAGDYTDVWTTVFHANMLLAQRGEDRVVWGIAARAAPTADRWRAVPADQTRVAVLRGQETAAHAALARYGVGPLAVDVEGQTLRLERPLAALEADRRSVEAPGQSR